MRWRSTDPVIDGLGPVASLTVPELPSHVPLLVDALAVCEGMVVNVEIKNDPGQPGYDPGETVAALTAAAIADAGWADRVVVSSFQVSTLRAVRAADGRLALGALWPVLAEVNDGLVLAAQEGFYAVHPFVAAVNAYLVDRAHAAGWRSTCGPPSPKDLVAFAALGVDALITDRLVEALAVAQGDGRDVPMVTT